MIFDHTHHIYQLRWENAGNNKWNGAHYYAKEISKNIIPHIKTDRNWVLLNQRGYAFDHAIVFIHNNLHPDHYDWLKDYNDLILVCGVPETCDKVKHLGIPIYLPLSVDVAEVSQYRRPKTKNRAFVGRPAKRRNKVFLEGTDILEGLPREDLLPKVAEYKQVYAVGRCAIEAKLLGCEILPYDERYPDTSIWEVLDNKDAANILQRELDKIDGTL